MIFLLLQSAVPIELPQASVSSARALFRKAPTPAAGESTVARVRLVVDNKGRIVECKLLHLVGTTRVANELCDSSIGVRLKPAADEAKAKSYASYVTSLSAFPDGEEGNRELLSRQLNQAEYPADMSLTVTQAPVGTDLTKRVLIKGKVDENGTMVVCEPQIEPSVQLARVACEQARQTTFETIRSKNGELVSYIRSVSVEFTTAD